MFFVYMSPGTNRLLTSPPIQPAAPKPIRILRKCCSDPLLFPATAGARRSSDSYNGQWFFRHHTFNDSIISTTSDIISPRLSGTNVGYKKDAKVLITVTVEGSPGPIRTLVQLRTSVEDIIRLVIQKYGEEGRMPRLPKDASSSFDLHVSYFSLQCLDRSNAIGETGSRNFYLRKSNIKKHEEAATTTTPPGTSEIVCVQESSSYLKQSSPPMVLFLLPPFMIRKINKIMRRIHKFFKILGCLDST